MIQIIGEMVGLENFSDESLCDFFLQNNLFLYRDKHFQIDRQSYDTISVFVIVRVSDESISTIDKTRSLRELRQDKMAVAHQHLSEDGYHPLLNQALGDWTNSHYPSIVLYKGIPIKAESSITDNSDGEIAVRVEKKQLSAAQIGVKWLIGNRRDKMVVGRVSRYDLSQSMIWLNHLEIIKDGFHLRQVIRYSNSSEDQIILTIKGKKYTAILHDLSEKGVSILTDNGALLLALSSLQGKTISLELLLSHSKISVHAAWLYTIAVEEGMQMKVAFSIGYDVHNGNLLREWLNVKQLQLIKEIRNFVQMIPPPQKESSAEWNI
jgi:hypothetical protein